MLVEPSWLTDGSDMVEGDGGVLDGLWKVYGDDDVGQSLLKEEG